MVTTHAQNHFMESHSSIMWPLTQNAFLEIIISLGSSEQSMEEGRDKAPNHTDHKAKTEKG